MEIESSNAKQNTGPPSNGRFCETSLSLFISVRQFGIFLRNWSLGFPYFLYAGNFSTGRALLSRKIHFCSNLDKKGPKWPQNRFFWIFWTILLLFPGNNLKWKRILSLIFHHQSHIWQISDSQVMGQNAIGQSNCKVL